MLLFFLVGRSPAATKSKLDPAREVLVVVNLDDIGVHQDQTDASFAAIRKGMAKTGTIMVPGPDFQRTAGLVKANPDLHFGIHITLTNEWQEKLPWSPLLTKQEVPSLYNEKGLMWPDQNLLAQHADAREAEKEMEKQIRVALASGIKLDHMDAHMGCYYLRPDLSDIAVRLAKKYRLAVVFPFPDFPESFRTVLQKNGLRCPDTFSGFYWIEGEGSDPSLALKTYENYLAGLGPGLHHLYIHTAYVTPETRRIMFDVAIRDRDFKIWTGEEIGDFAAKWGIKFISYSDL